jgi:hypothetical protein
MYPVDPVKNIAIQRPFPVIFERSMPKSEANRHTKSKYSYVYSSVGQNSIGVPPRQIPFESAGLCP